MSIKKAFILAASILSILNPASAQEIYEEVYLGADLKYRHLSFKHSQLGNKAHPVPEIGLIAGYRFHRHFALETGWNISSKRGIKNTEIKHDLKGLHTSMLAFIPVSGAYVIIGPGLTAARSMYRSPTIFKTKVKKVIPRILLGLEIDPVPGMGIRFSLVSEKTQKLYTKERIPLTLRHTFMFGMGVNYKF